ncbi:hypothetical protein CYMTET_24866 [Cymbomonas tetramitiformis]|uniref:Uncharacterized protein n=1 Tax=Cymbomonas tetramitiformis TaxID=36881 RepID=A0AAE0FVD7_9CHLO|nr:hypothetical protein CYMTET_24866 [Cymbomonas tetramitiformis]
MGTPDVDRTSAKAIGTPDVATSCAPARGVEDNATSSPTASVPEVAIPPVVTTASTATTGPDELPERCSRGASPSAPPGTPVGASAVTPSAEPVSPHSSGRGGGEVERPRQPRASENTEHPAGPPAEAGTATDGGSLAPPESPPARCRKSSQEQRSASNDAAGPRFSAKARETGAPKRPGRPSDSPIVVPIVLAMKPDDHALILEDWLSRRHAEMDGMSAPSAPEASHEGNLRIQAPLEAHAFSSAAPQAQLMTYLSEVAGRPGDGNPVAPVGSPAEPVSTGAAAVTRQMRELQEYLCKYQDLNVPVAWLRASTFPAVLDDLHDHLLACIEKALREHDECSGHP